MEMNGRYCELDEENETNDGLKSDSTRCLTYWLYKFLSYI